PDRLAGYVRPTLDGMLAVVQPDAQDLPGSHDRCPDTRSIDLDGGQLAGRERTPHPTGPVVTEKLVSDIGGQRPQVVRALAGQCHGYLSPHVADSCYPHPSSSSEAIVTCLDEHANFGEV